MSTEYTNALTRNVDTSSIWSGIVENGPELLEALKVCRDALATLTNHPAFADDAPEFNKGGIGYEAAKQASETIARATNQ